MGEGNRGGPLRRERFDVSEDMQDFLREDAFRRWRARGGPGDFERWFLLRPGMTVVVAGVILGVACVGLILLTGTVTVPAVLGAVSHGLVSSYLIQSDRLKALRGLYREWDAAPEGESESTEPEPT